MTCLHAGFDMVLPIPASLACCAVLLSSPLHTYPHRCSDAVMQIDFERFLSSVRGVKRVLEGSSEDFGCRRSGWSTAAARAPPMVGNRGRATSASFGIEVDTTVRSGPLISPSFKESKNPVAY